MRWLKHFFFVLVISLLLAEVSLRVVSTFEFGSQNFMPDPETGYRMRPNLERSGYTTNRLGFNDKDRADVKPSGVTRVGIVGDSFVFGVVPRADNFVTVLDGMAAQAGRPLAFVNLGIPGAGPVNYLGLIRGDAARLNMDVACVVLFVGNDITQSHPDTHTRLWLGLPHEMLAQPHLLRPRLDSFYVYLAGRALYRRLVDRISSEDTAFSQRTFLAIARQRMSVYARDDNARLASAYAHAIDHLKSMRAAAAASNMEFMVILAPDQIQVDGPLRDAVIARYQLDARHFDFDRPQNIITPRLRAVGIEVLDLLPAFRAHEGTALYETFDTHWNARGNRLAAEQIWRALTNRSGLLAPPAPQS